MPNLRFLGMSNNPILNPKKDLQAQVPRAFITTLPITTANIRKWSAIVGAGAAALIGAIAAVAVARKKADRKEEAGPVTNGDPEEALSEVVLESPNVALMIGSSKGEG